MTSCVSTRAQRPLILLMRVENWLGQWSREALDQRRDIEATELLAVQNVIRRVTCELLQSESYGGPLAPETRRFARGSLLLLSVDEWLTSRLGEARANGSAESVELWAARRTVRSLLSEVIESWKKSNSERDG